jgi:uncharacterized membrane protein
VRCRSLNVVDRVAVAVERMLVNVGWILILVGFKFLSFGEDQDLYWGDQKYYLVHDSILNSPLCL